MIDGLGYLYSLVQIYRIKEDLYLNLEEQDIPTAHEAFEATIVNLYSHIWEYQARMIHYMKNRSLERLARNCGGIDDWEVWLNQV